MIRYLPDDPRAAVRLIDAEAEGLDTALIDGPLLEVDVNWTDDILRGDPDAVLHHLAQLYVRASSVVIESKVATT